MTDEKGQPPIDELEVWTPTPNMPKDVYDSTRELQPLGEFELGVERFTKEDLLALIAVLVEKLDGPVMVTEVEMLAAVKDGRAYGKIDGSRRSWTVWQKGYIPRALREPDSTEVRVRRGAG